MTAKAEMAASAGCGSSWRTSAGSTATPPRGFSTCSNRWIRPALGLAFDPANFLEVGQPIDEAWAMLKPRLEPFPRQGFRSGDPQMRSGRSGRWADPATDRRRRSTTGYEGFCTLEPHLLVAAQSHGFTGPERFGEAATALKSELTKRRNRILVGRARARLFNL